MDNMNILLNFLVTLTPLTWKPTLSPERFELEIDNKFVEVSRWQYDPPEDYPFYVYELNVRNSKGWVVDECSSMNDEEYSEKLASIYIEARKIALKSEEVIGEICKTLEKEPPLLLK